MNTWPTTLTRASRGPCRSTVQAVFGPNLANNLFASSCDKRRPGDGFFTTTMGMSMNDNEGALAVIIIVQWVAVALLRPILWRRWLWCSGGSGSDGGESETEGEERWLTCLLGCGCC